MAEKTYIVKAGRFGYVKNRDAVDQAAYEGRTVQPLAEYVEQGQEVKLDASHALTKKALETGSIEEKSSSKSGG